MNRSATIAMMLPPSIPADSVPTITTDSTVGAPVVGDIIHYEASNKTLVVTSRTWKVANLRTTLEINLEFPSVN